MANIQELLIQIDASTESLRRELKKAEIGSGAPVRTMQNLYGIRRRSI